MTTFSEYFWITANIGSLRIKKIMLEERKILIVVSKILVLTFFSNEC